jgi:hypothetical protein
MSERTYQVWVQIEQWEDDEPLPDDLPIHEFAATYATEREDEARTVASIMHRLGIVVPELLDHYANRPTPPADGTGAGTGEWVYYDEVRADWGEALDAIIRPTLTDEDRS